MNNTTETLNKPSRLAVTNYIYIAQISASVGGRTGSLDGLYINANGEMQISRTSTDGTLSHLWLAAGQESRFSELAKQLRGEPFRAWGSGQTLEAQPESSDLATEYYPQKWWFDIQIEKTESEDALRVNDSIPVEKAPTDIAEWMMQMTPLFDINTVQNESAYQAAEEGLYLLTRSTPREMAHRKGKLQLTAQDVNRSVLLQSTFGKLQQFTRVGELGPSAIIGDSAVLVPGRQILTRTPDGLFVMGVFKLDTP